jgi:hypothetical protein
MQSVQHWVQRHQGTRHRAWAQGVHVQAAAAQPAPAEAAAVHAGKKAVVVGAGKFLWSQAKQKI